MKVIVGNQVAHFRVNGKNIMPGETVVLPDTYPVKLYKQFLTVVGSTPVVAAPVRKPLPIAPVKPARSTRR